MVVVGYKLQRRAVWQRVSDKLCRWPPLMEQLENAKIEKLRLR